MQVNRREFVTLLGGAVAAWPVVAHGQQPGMPGDWSPWPHFDKDLAEADFVENRNVAFEFRWADGQFDRLPGLAADLVGHKVAIIAAFGEQSAVAGERVRCIKHREAQQVLGGYRHLAETLGVRAHEPQNPTRRAVGLHGFHPHRLVEKWANKNLTQHSAEASCPSCCALTTHGHSALRAGLRAAVSSASSRSNSCIPIHDDGTPMCLVSVTGPARSKVDQP